MSRSPFSVNVSAAPSSESWRDAPVPIGGVKTIVGTSLISRRSSERSNRSEFHSSDSVDGPAAEPK